MGNKQHRSTARTAHRPGRDRARCKWTRTPLVPSTGAYRDNVTPRDTSTQQRSTYTNAHNTAQLTRPPSPPLDKQALGLLLSFLRCRRDSPDCPLVQLEQSRPYSAASEGTASGSAPCAPTHQHANSSRRCAQTRRQPIFFTNVGGLQNKR